MRNYFKEIKEIKGIILVISFLIIIGVCTHLRNEYEIKTKEIVSKVESFQESILFAGNEDIDMETKVIDYIHRLTHPVIIATDKWREDIVPTPDNVKRVLDEINKNHYNFMGNRKDIIRILEAFLKGDFREADTLHNIVWEIQDGIVGRAMRTDIVNIRIIVNEYYEK